jgi:hypothetical protein
MSDYDSRPDTHEHIGQVRGLLLGVAADLTGRAHRHDRSKLEPPEVEVFDEFTPKLRDSTYGSDEYKEFLAGMGEGRSTTTPSTTTTRSTFEGKAASTP